MGSHLAPFMRTPGTAVVSGIPMEEAPPSKQQIAATHTFGRVVETLAELKEDAASYCMRAGEKLREQHSLVGVLTVFIATLSPGRAWRRNHSGLLCERNDDLGEHPLAQGLSVLAGQEWLTNSLLTMS